MLCRLDGIHFFSYASQNRVRIPPLLRSGILLISASYEGDGTDIGYTLTMYTQKNVKLAWIENQKPPSYREKVGSIDFLVQYSVVTGKKGNWLSHFGDCGRELYTPYFHDQPAVPPVAASQ